MVRLELENFANGRRRLFVLGGKLIARLSAAVARSSYKMPMLSALVFAFVLGTFIAGGMSVLAPSVNQPKSTYEVMSEFFEKRRALEDPTLPRLLRLNTRNLDPSAIKHSMNVAGVSAGIVRINVHYFRPKENAQGPLRLSLTNGTGDSQNASIISTSILPSQRPVKLEIRTEGQPINLDLARSPENRGARWPKTIISIVQVPDE